MLLSVTAVPAAVALLIRKPRRAWRVARHARMRERVYAPLLATAIRRLRRQSWRARRCWLVLRRWLASRMGSEFLPSLDEGDIAMHALRIPGTSLTQAIGMQTQLEAAVRALPEVERIVAKLGTADIATDPMPPSVADNFIILKDRDQWPDPRKPKAQVVADLERAVRVIPGNNYEFTQPIQMRFNELLSGVRADVAVKVYGDDLEQLAEIGRAASNPSLQAVPGARDVALEQVTGLPVLSVQPRRAALSRYGLDVAALQDTVAASYGGEVVGAIYDGDRRHDLVVRLPEALRRNVDALSRLPLALPDGGYVPLGEVAELELDAGTEPGQPRERQAARGSDCQCPRPRPGLVRRTSCGRRWRRR